MLMTKDCLNLLLPLFFWSLEIIHFYRHFLFIFFVVCWCLFGLVWLFLSYALLFSLTYFVRTYWATPAGVALWWIRVTRLVECLFQEKPVASASAAALWLWRISDSHPGQGRGLHSWDIISLLFSWWVIEVDEARDRDVRIEMWHFLASLPFHVSLQLFVNHSCPTESISFVTNNMKRYFINNSV